MSQKQKITLILTILISSFILSLTMIRSGINYSFGLGFWGPNGHDGIWHLSLINQLQKNLPPSNPVYSGSILSNYHWGFDLLAAVLGKIFQNNSLVYFQILPPLLGLLLGFLSFRLIKQTSKNFLASYIFTLLVYFSGSFGWVYTLIKSGQIGGESLFWSMQSASMLINPPFVLSLIVMISGLIIWSKNHNSNNYVLAVLNGTIFGILAGIKVYAGIIIGLSLVIFWLIETIKTKKKLNYNLIVWLTTLVISLFILYLLGVLNNSSLLEFKPLWFTHSLIESIDKFYLPQLAAYRINLSQNLSLIKIPLLLFIEVGLIVIFVLGNMGIRSLAFIKIYQKIKRHSVNYFDQLILIVMSISLIIPLLFVQKGTAWNTIQFFYYFLFFANIFLAQFIFDLIHKFKKSSILVVVCLFLISNITTIATIKDYLGNPPPSAIPSPEVEAINFLKSQKDGIVLTYPYDQYAKNHLNLKTPLPMYLYETTAYVSAFSHQVVYLEDEMNLDITGFNWLNRKAESQKFFQSNDQFYARGFLVNNQISYIYLINGQQMALGESQLQINKIFDNNQVKIYQVQK